MAFYGKWVSSTGLERFIQTMCDLPMLISTVGQFALNHDCFFFVFFTFQYIAETDV